MQSPLKSKPLHLPGQSINEKLNDFLDEKIFSYFLVAIVTVVFIMYEWIRKYQNIPPAPIQMTIVGSIVIVFCIFRIRKNISTARALILGRDGERIVGQQLEELREIGAHVFHDVLGPGFNVDHVIISPYGIFTVETKTWSKKNSQEVIKFDGKNLVVNGILIKKDPLTQSVGEANWLSSLIKQSTGKEFKVKPVLVFPGWFVDPESSKRAQGRGVWLLNPKALPAYIKNYSETLSKEDLSMISLHLSRYIQTA